MKYNVLILSLFGIISLACNPVMPSTSLDEGLHFNAPALLYFKNIRANAYVQTSLTSYIESYELKPLLHKQISFQLLISKLEDKAQLRIQIASDYDLWENIEGDRARLVQLDQMSFIQQKELLQKMAEPNGNGFAIQFIEPKANGSMETISTNSLRRNISILLADFDRLTSPKG